MVSEAISKKEIERVKFESKDLHKPDEYWREHLTEEAFYVCRQQGQKHHTQVSCYTIKTRVFTTVPVAKALCLALKINTIRAAVGQVLMRRLMNR